MSDLERWIALALVGVLLLVGLHLIWDALRHPERDEEPRHHKGDGGPGRRGLG